MVSTNEWYIEYFQQGSHTLSKRNSKMTVKYGGQQLFWFYFIYAIELPAVYHVHPNTDLKIQESDIFTTGGDVGR